jgi:hypothetical protein
MVLYKDHNGTTTFGDHVKSFTYAQLVDAFAGKHDIGKLAKVLGIKVERGDSKPLVSEEKTEKPKRKKED